MNKIEENLNELLDVLNGTGVPNNTWVKEKLEETLILVKNCSIPNFVGSFWSDDAITRLKSEYFEKGLRSK